jgi:hypothetical protein
MDSSDKGNKREIRSACEYQALKSCLEKNNWKKEKCEKEWVEFENLCSTNRRLAKENKLQLPEK